MSRPTPHTRSRPAHDKQDAQGASPVPNKPSQCPTWLLGASDVRMNPTGQSTSGAARAAVVALVALAVLASPVAASAHLRSGTIAVDYQARVLRPNTYAYSAQIYQSDHGLSLTVKPGHVVVMLGYLGEPVFRLDRVGLWVNAASPTAVAVRLLHKAQAIDAPTPRWRLLSGEHSAVWHDARAQQLPPGVDQGAWSVPLIVDRRSARLEGELRRFPAPSLWLWLVILACVLGASAAPLLLRRRDLARAGAIGCAILAATASVVIALAFALDAYASPGTWIVGLDVIAFLAVGVGVLLRGPQNLHVAGAIGIGLVSLAVGLLDGAVFLHPIVLAILPGTVIRFAEVMAIGAGLNAAALGSMFFAEIAEAVLDSGRDLGLRAPVEGAPERAGRRGFGA
jgi:hypothetical protein